MVSQNTEQSKSVLKDMLRLNSENMDENAIENIRRAFMKKAPTREEIEDKLILDSIFVDKDTEIEEFIQTFVQKITA